MGTVLGFFLLKVFIFLMKSTTSSQNFDEVNTGTEWGWVKVLKNPKQQILFFLYPS